MGTCFKRASELIGNDTIKGLVIRYMDLLDTAFYVQSKTGFHVSYMSSFALSLSIR